MRRVFSSVDVSETVLVRDAFRPPAEFWIRHDQGSASEAVSSVAIVLTTAQETPAAIWSSVVTVRQLRAVASTPRSRSARPARRDAPNPSGVYR